MNTQLSQPDRMKNQHPAVQENCNRIYGMIIDDDNRWTSVHDHLRNELVYCKGKLTTKLLWLRVWKATKIFEIQMSTLWSLSNTNTLKHQGGT